VHANGGGDVIDAEIGSVQIDHHTPGESKLGNTFGYFVLLPSTSSWSLLSHFLRNYVDCENKQPCHRVYEKVK